MAGEGTSNGPERGTPRLVLEVYGLLTADEDARACREIPEAACRAQPGSFLLHLLASSATKIADELASAKLVLAWLLAALGAPAYLVALLVPVREAGALLPQLAVAGAMRRAAVRKWFWVAGSVAQGLAAIAMGVVAVTVADGTVAGWAVVALLALLALARGVCSVAHKDVLGKTVDKARRGTAMGYAAALAGVATIAVGAYLALLRGQSAEQGVFLLLLGGAGLLWLTGAAVLALLDEQPGATEGGASALREALASLSLLRRDAAFRHFLVTRALLLSTAFSLPFYVVLAREQGGEVSALGLLMVASGVAAGLSAPVWGRLADRSSRRVLIAAAVLAGLTGLALVGALAAGLPGTGSAWAMAGFFLVIGVAHSGVRLGRKTYLIDLATERTRASYVAVSNTLIGAFLLAGGVLGLVAERFGTRVVILVLAVMALAAAASAARLPEVEE